MRVIIDLDETLIDTLERQYILLNDLIFNKENLIEKENYLSLKSKRFSNIEILLKNGIDLDLANKIHKKYINKIESQNYLKLDSLIVDYSLLRYFSDRYELHLCSMRSNVKTAEEQLSSLNLSRLFKSISWVAHSETQGKIPSVKKISDNYGNIDLYIGDSITDKDAALHNNIKFIYCDRFKKNITINKLINQLL